jgi:hypothetical protein
MANVPKQDPQHRRHPFGLEGTPKKKHNIRGSRTHHITSILADQSIDKTRSLLLALLKTVMINFFGCHLVKSRTSSLFSLSSLLLFLPIPYDFQPSFFFTFLLQTFPLLPYPYDTHFYYLSFCFLFLFCFPFLLLPLSLASPSFCFPFLFFSFLFLLLTIPNASPFCYKPFLMLPLFLLLPLPFANPSFANPS